MNNDIAKVRRENLRRLIDQMHGPTAVAKRLGFGGPSYVSQMAAGGKPITEKTARKIEQKMGFPQFSFDTEPGEPLPFAGTDHSLIAAVVRAVGEALEKSKLQAKPAKFAELVAIAYESAAKAGRVDQAQIERLVALLK